MSSLEYHRNYYKEYKKRVPWKFVLKDVKTRCKNLHMNSYKYYGGRGIKCLITETEIKELWFRDKAYLMKRPSIDRIKSDQNYTFDNCRFIELVANTRERNLRVGFKTRVIKQFDLQGNFIKEWESLAAAARYLNINSARISNVLNGNSRHAEGFIWK